jgi:hypothetical protein
MAIEIYKGVVPKEITDIPPREGYVTFLSIDTRDRHECMKIAVDALMGTLNGAYTLATPHRYLLQCFRIDDTETTVIDFAAAVTRIIQAGKLGIGPEVADAWMTVFNTVNIGGHRTVFGFIILVKPDSTLAEYSVLFPRGKDSDWLIEAVGKAAPLVRDLVVRISNGGFCWPGPLLDPHGIGLYMDQHGNPQLAVVVDWSSCVMGAAPIERIMPPLLANYKKFLDMTDKSNLENHRDLFYEAIRNLV